MRRRRYDEDSNGEGSVRWKRRSGSEMTAAGFEIGQDGTTELDVVGGHGSKKNKGLPILVRGNTILKPFQKGKGELEAGFYEYISKTNHVMKAFIPRFYGCELVGDDKYLKLENLTYGLDKPCVLDLKMGTQTYDEAASAAKIERELKKYPPQQVIGFRIVGMKVWRRASGDEFKSSRTWCMSLKPEGMEEAIQQFFFDGRVLNESLMVKLSDKLSEIEDMLRNSPQWRIYGSSLLIVYDGAVMNPEIKVRMIDFAHTFPISDGGVDAGYLHGLNFLQTCLQQKREERRNPQQCVQVGGSHNNIVFRNGEVVKVEDKKEQFDTEVQFYLKVRDSDDSMGRVMPKLIAVLDSVSPRELVISDARDLVRDELRSISIMDIKLGVRSFRRDCPNTPKASYYKKFTTLQTSLPPGRCAKMWKSLVGSEHGPESLKSETLGKRDYLGFRDAMTTSKDYGFRLSALVHGDFLLTIDGARLIGSHGQFMEHFEAFLSSSAGVFDVQLAVEFVTELEKVSRSIKDSKLFCDYEMVGTSLLFLHCGRRAAIRWIDFANANSNAAQRGNQQDSEGILKGVSLLSASIEELAARHQK